ncbi:MAG TPA: histidine phosphatase family protein [Solirubrobacteraceae bacterium]|jgi:phosphohistidine phosphatase|nr:histidine phosphatase family protein [Solirubrobacteraceae bacterium]
MARQLWLLRHADAEPHGTRPDAERRVTERGELQARLAGHALARIGVEFQEILSSPKERALATAQLALEEWTAVRAERVPVPADPLEILRALDRVRVHEPLGEGFDGAQALAALAALPSGGRLLAVGHEPDLSGVVAQLTGARIDLKKGGLAVIRIAAHAALDSGASSAGAGGELVLLLRPVELALVAGVGDADTIAAV